jgi:hypothetical protein
LLLAAAQILPAESTALGKQAKNSASMYEDNVAIAVEATCLDFRDHA